MSLTIDTRAEERQNIAVDLSVLDNMVEGGQPLLSDRCHYNSVLPFANLCIAMSPISNEVG